ncbi:MAG: hypothetical protein ABID61_04595 [Candidatus Micrarchaeota archaeon]
MEPRPLRTREIAHALTARRGWPKLEPLRIEPVSARLAEHIFVRPPEPLPPIKKERPFVVKAFISGATLIMNVAAVLLLTATTMVGGIAGGLTALASTVALPIELTFGRLSGELRILNTFPHIKELPASLSTFVLGIGIWMVTAFPLQMMDTSPINVREFLHSTKEFFKDSANVVAHTLVYSTLTVGFGANIVHCIETGVISTTGIVMLALAAVGHGILKFRREQNKYVFGRPKSETIEKVAKMVSDSVNALMVTVGITSAVEVGIGIAQNNAIIAMSSVPYLAALLILEIANIVLIRQSQKGR